MNDRDGSRDAASQIRHLARRLPEALAPLAGLALNYRWCWAPPGEELFREIDPVRWERSGQNPIRLLTEARQEDLERLARDRPRVARIAEAGRSLAAELAGDAQGPVPAGSP